MRSEARVVQFFDCVLHVLVAQELNDAGTILVSVREADVAGLAHVILEILPRSGGGQSSNHDAVLRALGWRSASAHPSPTVAASVIAVAAAVASRTTAPRELHAQTIPIVVVPVARLHRIVGIPKLGQEAAGGYGPWSRKEEKQLSRISWVS